MAQDYTGTPKKVFDPNTGIINLKDKTTDKSILTLKVISTHSDLTNYAEIIEVSSPEGISFKTERLTGFTETTISKQAPYLGNIYLLTSSVKTYNKPIFDCKGIKRLEDCKITKYELISYQVNEWVQLP